MAPGLKEAKGKPCVIYKKNKQRREGEKGKQNLVNKYAIKYVCN
jgi:hypothetical protein